MTLRADNDAVIDAARDRLDKDVERLLSGAGREAWRIYRDDAERRRRKDRSEDETREVPLPPKET